MRSESWWRASWPTVLDPQPQKDFCTNSLVGLFFSLHSFSCSVAIGSFGTSANADENQPMSNSLGSMRLALTAAFLLGAFILLHSVSHGEPAVPRQPLRDLPYTVGTWSGQERPLSEQMVQ